ncbi:MAG: hypothetical protein IKP28_02330 [Clostridia bacterium]|nr:hypothetical protein [Clostridia bacterium]
MYTNIRIKLRNFIKEHKWKVILGIIAWAVLFVINQFLANAKIEVPITTYDPYKPIIENGQTTPNKWQEKIENMIDEYINLCNEKEYEKAYNMINEDCRKEVYPSLEDFQAYVDYVFATDKVYSIQNYSNRDNIYIYRVRIFDDILATGLTNDTSFKYFEDRMSFKETNGKLTMSVKEFIDKDNFDKVYEDKYIRIAITEKRINYDYEKYTIRFTNKTEHYAAISDGAMSGNIKIETENGEINQTAEGYEQPIILPPRGSITLSIQFTKLFDLGVKTTGMKFNNVRILRSYSGDESLKEQELQEAVELYSFTIPL